MFKTKKVPSLTTVLETSALPRRCSSALPQGILFRPTLPSPRLREGGAKKNASPLPGRPPLRSALPVHRRRRPVIQGLMQTLLVVIREVPAEPALQLRHPLVPPQVEVLILDRPPQPFHEHVVQAPALAVHAHLHPRRLQPPRPPLRPELHPLVGVEHLGP